jgi:hypothetical protein
MTAPVPYETVVKQGTLPVVDAPVRFAVGDPSATTSNSWRVWVEKHSELYIACRDNFKEAKVSLHASGSWRMAITTEALRKDATLVLPGENRAWEIWDKPSPSLPNTVVAFHLYFPTSELAVEPHQRIGKLWKDVLYIEAGPPGKMTVVTLFLTKGVVQLHHESEPGFLLAIFKLNDDWYAQLFAHGEPEGNFSETIEQGKASVMKMAEEKGITIPEQGYAYLFGHRDNGARFLFGVRPKR